MHRYIHLCSLAFFVAFASGSAANNGYRDPVYFPENIFEPFVRQVTTCTDGLKASVLLDKCFNSTYTLIRKGLADDVATGHFRAAIMSLKKFAIGIGSESNTVALKDVCIPADFYSITFSVRWTTVYTESVLDDMLMSISNSFYDVRNQSQVLPELTAFQLAQKDQQRAILFGEIAKPISTMNVSLIALPKSVDHSYDEKNAKACTEWRKNTMDEKRTAKEGLRKLLYMVVQLIATGCDPNRSWQIIRHYSALVSLGIRCDKKEGEQLLVPDDYMVDYISAAMRLSNEAERQGNLKPLSTVSDEIFDSCFKLMYERLSTFGSWGQSDTMFTSDLVIKNMMSYVIYTINSRLKVGSGTEWYPT